MRGDAPERQVRFRKKCEGENVMKYRGGLLVTAVTIMRPDLFKAVVALVPFTNVICTMLMPELPLVVVEYEQWGNPNDPQASEMFK